MLKELGYDGVGQLWLDNIPERLKTLDAAGLKLFQITMTVNITPGKQAYDPRFKEVMPLLKGRGVQFLLLMNGMKPSDPAGDARAVEIVREIAALASARRTDAAVSAHAMIGWSGLRTACAWRTKWTARTWALCSTCAIGCASARTATTGRCW